MWRKKEVYWQVLWCLNVTVSVFGCFLKMLKPTFSLYYCRMSKMDLWFIYVKKLYSTKLSLLTEKGNFAVSCRNGVFHQNNLLPNQSGFANLLLKKKILVWLKRKAKTKYLGFRVCWEFSPHSGKPAILVGVSQMEHNVWKPFKWLFDNLIKENASSHCTPPTVDK